MWGVGTANFGYPMFAHILPKPLYSNIFTRILGKGRPNFADPTPSWIWSSTLCHRIMSRCQGVLRTAPGPWRAFAPDRQRPQTSQTTVRGMAIHEEVLGNEFSEEHHSPERGRQEEQRKNIGIAKTVFWENGVFVACRKQGLATKTAKMTNLHSIR